MSVIDDITALLTPVLHTNTTKDITAAAVKAALISAFTDVIGAMPDPVVGAKVAESLARGVAPLNRNLLGTRSGQFPGESGYDWQLDDLVPLPPGYEGYVIDKGINGSTGAADATSVGTLTTNFIPVTPSGKITLGSGAGYVAFYDKDKNFINPPGLTGSYTSPFGSLSIPWAPRGSGAGVSVDVPANAVFMRTSVQYYRDSNRAVHRAAVLEGEQTLRHPFYHMIASANMFRPWCGKVWSMQGDSIAADWMSGPWAVDAAKYHGCDYIKVEAYPGNTVDKLNKKGNGGAVTDLANSYYDDVDAVVCFVGSNDASSFTTRPLGAITDATTADTFYGWYKKFIEARLTYKPLMRIILCTILQRGGGVLSETSRATFNAAIREIAAFYGCHLWDIGTYGNYFSPFTFADFSSDQTHLEYRHWAIIDSGHPRIIKDMGATVVLSNNFKAFMHTCLPADYIGDPFMTERDDDQIYFVRRVPG